MKLCIKFDGPGAVPSTSTKIIWWLM